MILTKSKKDILNLASGITPEIENIEIVEETHVFWVDWAIAFQKFCKNTFGLEVENGPGTSIGIYHTEYGPNRFQYDCDWTRPYGRVSGYESQDIGTTLWGETDIWSTYNNTDNTVGIDKTLKRFDFIIWFTNENDSNDYNRIGLRFKYPITNEKGYYTNYCISKFPAIMPWTYSLKNNSFNNSFNNAYSNLYPNLIESRVDAYKFSEEKDTHIFYPNIGLNFSLSNSKYSINNDSIFSSNLTSWEDITTNTLSIQTQNSDYKDFHYCTIFVSKNFDVIDFKIKKSEAYNADMLFDILYGNLIEELDSENSVSIPSFISFKSNKSTQGTAFSDFVLTSHIYNVKPSILVNRPTTASNENQTNYWGISRVQLNSETIYCTELYQVFNFSDLMANSEYTIKVFIDSNGDEHLFLLFNYGYTTDELINQSIALAIPIEG